MTESSLLQQPKFDPFKLFPTCGVHNARDMDAETEDRSQDHRCISYQQQLLLQKACGGENTTEETKHLR